MKQDIIRFIRKVKSLYGVEAIYVPDNDVYSIRFKGKAVHNFNSKNFYQLPQRYRESLVQRLIRVGLHHNIGEKSVKNSLILNRALGKRI